MKLYRALPAAYAGRSQFIIQTLSNAVNRSEAEWQPTTARGRKLKAILDRGASERGEPLDAAGIAAELRKRRGGIQ